MLRLCFLSTFAAVQMPSQTTAIINHSLPPNTNPINFKIDPYCGGCVPQNSTNPNTCPLSGRVTINAEMISDPAIRTYLNGQTPQMSVNLDAIQRLADNVLTENYPILSDQELPYLALGAYVAGKLTVETTSDLLIGHQETRDSPAASRIEIVPIFKKMLPIFRSEEQLSEILSKLNFYQKNILRFKLLKLPISQQVMRIGNGRGELSMAAHRVFIEVLSGHPAFDQKPQLGDFSKLQIIETEIAEGKRLRYVPMPGVEATTILEGKKVSHSEFSLHDRRDHVDGALNIEYSPMLVNALREILSVLLQKLGKVTPMIWELGDFDFIVFSKDNNAILARKIADNVKHREEACIIITHMLDNQIRWREEYQISADQVMSKLGEYFDPYYVHQYREYKELISSCIGV